MSLFTKERELYLEFYEYESYINKDFIEITLTKFDSKEMIITYYYNDNFYECDFDLIKAKDKINILSAEYELGKSGWKLPFTFEFDLSPTWEQIYINCVTYSIYHF